MDQSKFNSIKPTLIFALVGLFIPGFTAGGLSGLQLILSSIGVECSTAWSIIWKSTKQDWDFLIYSCMYLFSQA